MNTNSGANVDAAKNTIFLAEMSTHAQIRRQQRCIPVQVIDWLLEYGKERYDHRGGVIRYFDKAAKRTIKKIADSQGVKLIGDYFDCYLVESAWDGNVITLGYLTHRVTNW